MRSIQNEQVAKKGEEGGRRDERERDKTSTGESIITISVDDLSLACAPSGVQVGS